MTAALDRAFRILELLAGHPDGLPLQVIADRLELPKSACTPWRPNSSSPPRRCPWRAARPDGSADGGTRKIRARKRRSEAARDTVTAPTASPAGLAQDIQERTIRWGHLNNTDRPVSLGVKKFTEIVAAKSGGKLKICEYPASQLGNEMQQQSALRGGTQEGRRPRLRAGGRGPGRSSGGVRGAAQSPFR